MTEYAQVSELRWESASSQIIKSKKFVWFTKDKEGVIVHGEADTLEAAQTAISGVES